MDSFEHRTGEGGSTQQLEEKKITWCHRMRTTRDHAEIPEIMELLGLDGHGHPIKDSVLWEKTINKRKGTGLSMASKMNELTAAQKA
ncbi:hypothetical protein NQ176_g11234 [Zarea fungicola]|uniref:Uncharacterized protein n=1 Tax=Zarea fungicola TaxID=93591 RepID=A0ACC1MBD4_9HYPO|nr:hypothetical protein NQ176_g11234 [Lecanicillium fungicola]